MLTAKPCDALSSFARLSSSVRPCRLFPGRRGPPLRIYRWEKTTVVAVKIKLKRLGKIREPYYRIVVADARTKRDGRAIEEIGKYHPKQDPSLIEVNSERAQHWLSVGAQPTDPVLALLKITGDWQKFTGEAGAEGTLRTAEPRGDKKERFEAAAKESQARKEAKEDKASKTGTQSRAAKPARDTSAKESPAKDAPAAAKDAPAAAKDAPAAVKDAPAAVKDAPAAVKDAPAAVKDAPAPAKDTAAPAKDTAAAAKDAPAPAKDTAAEESTAEASGANAADAVEANEQTASQDAGAAEVKAAAGESRSGA
jgi:small subunit ribosomal protein S16